MEVTLWSAKMELEKMLGLSVSLVEMREDAVRLPTFLNGRGVFPRGNGLMASR